MYFPEFTFSSVNGVDEERFVQSCFKSIEYKKYISESTPVLKNTLIIYSDNDMIGTFNPDISRETGVKVATPSLYIAIKMSGVAGLILGEIIYYLFEKQSVELVRLPVYSVNYKVIRIMKRIGIKFDGVFKRARVLDGKLIDMYFFSIRYDEYIKLKKKFNYEFIK